MALSRYSLLATVAGMQRSGGRRQRACPPTENLALSEVFERENMAVHHPPSLTGEILALMIFFWFPTTMGVTHVERRARGYLRKRDRDKRIER
jgi:hypothetical protein